MSLLGRSQRPATPSLPDCARRRGFDLCVSSGALEAVGGDPLLVKVKRSLAPGTLDRVLRNLADRPIARHGLVVYLESAAGDRSPSCAQPGPNRFPVLAGRNRFPVLVISTRQLLRSMASASFAEVVSRLGPEHVTAAGPPPHPAVIPVRHDGLYPRHEDAR
jgi:hypothetical protein